MMVDMIFTIKQMFSPKWKKNILIKYRFFKSVDLPKPPAAITFPSM